MIDLATSLLMAQKAYGLLKKGIDSFKEIDEMRDSISDFYEAKDAVSEAQKAANTQPLANKIFARGSVERHAMDVIQHREQIKKIELELKRYFREKGQTQMYYTMMKERRAERSRRNAEIKAQLERKKLLYDLIFILAIISTGLVATGYSVYLVIG